MGDPERADAATVPALPWIDDGAWHHIKDSATIRARYSLLVDNLTDLSHETSIRGATIGSMDIVETPETKHGTHPFRFISKSFGFDQPEWGAQTISRGHTRVLEEDRVALELLEQNLPRDGRRQELSVNFDRGGLQWRRVIRQRLGGQSEANETIE
jgi:hypothetical protein